MPWGKSAALAWLAPRVASARVPAGCVVRRSAWEADRARCLRELALPLDAERFAVRSDASVEDRLSSSCAGQFTSLLDVSLGELEAAIDRVLRELPGDADDAALVQPMVRDAVFVGVASTHRVKDGAPWYCLELAQSGPTAVTDGRASGRLVAVARHEVDERVGDLDAVSRAVIATLREVEALSAGVPLEIEFCVQGDKDDRQGTTDDCEAPASTDGSLAAIDARMPSRWTVTLLQARPLATASRWPAMPPRIALPDLSALRERDACAGVHGERAVWSLMSDWNPAELLGTHPRPLALSLFRRLIGDGAWWTARARLGYRAPPSPSIELLRVVEGRPFVDVRRSANSLLPEGLPDAVQGALVDAWLARLRERPELHDKVEFRVFRTGRDFTASGVVAREWSDVVGRDAQRDWEDRLGAVTRACIDATLAGAHRAHLLAMQASDPSTQPWRDALWTCAAGTGEFAVLARLAFVAEAQLRSAVEREALTPTRAQALRRAIGSVGALERRQHEERADTGAHLRPGTFDITQATRRGVAAHAIAGAAGARFALRGDESRRLGALLREGGFAQEADAWLRFVVRACRAREWGKFVFTRHLSVALDGIARELAALGLERDAASWFTLHDLESTHSLPRAQRIAALEASVARAAARHARERRVMLSPILADARDSGLADSLGILPNFVGDEVVSGRVVMLDARSATAPDLQDAVVVLRNADPGYDYIFSHGIRGLITAWGGAHSHMAIRCAEFGLSAAIGCGEAVFRRTRRAARACIDPLQGSLWLHA